MFPVTGASVWPSFSLPARLADEHGRPPSPISTKNRGVTIRCPTSTRHICAAAGALNRILTIMASVWRTISRRTRLAAERRWPWPSPIFRAARRIMPRPTSNPRHVSGCATNSVFYTTETSVWQSFSRRTRLAPERRWRNHAATICRPTSKRRVCAAAGAWSRIPPH